MTLGCSWFVGTGSARIEVSIVGSSALCTTQIRSIKRKKTTRVNPNWGVLWPETRRRRPCAIAGARGRGRVLSLLAGAGARGEADGAANWRRRVLLVLDGDAPVLDGHKRRRSRRISARKQEGKSLGGAFRREDVNGANRMRNGSASSPESRRIRCRTGGGRR